MSRTAFAPQVHGFTFGNSWEFDEAERQHLRGYFSGYLARRTILGPMGDFLVALGFLFLRHKLENHLAPVYGLCGGMCFTALDFYEAGLVLPREQNSTDHPAPGTRLRSYLWERQLDSLVRDGLRFLAWLLALHYVPRFWPFRGGTGWLLARSKAEWKELRASVDRGEPVIIGLVRDTKNVYENHQVLVIGYENVDDARSTMTLYDPNCPGGESTIRIQFGEQQLDGWESCGAEASLRGFFCETYAPFSRSFSSNFSTW
jgi:hypothetical protein